MTLKKIYNPLVKLGLDISGDDLNVIEEAVAIKNIGSYVVGGVAYYPYNNPGDLVFDTETLKLVEMVWGDENVHYEEIPIDSSIVYIHNGRKYKRTNLGLQEIDVEVLSIKSASDWGYTFRQRIDAVGNLFDIDGELFDDFTYISAIDSNARYIEITGSSREDCALAALYYAPGLSMSDFMDAPNKSQYAVKVVEFGTDREYDNFKVNITEKANYVLYYPKKQTIGQTYGVHKLKESQYYFAKYSTVKELRSEKSIFELNRGAWSQNKTYTVPLADATTRNFIVSPDSASEDDYTYYGLRITETVDGFTVACDVIPLVDIYLKILKI